jgi:hypothetical protein
MSLTNPGIIGRWVLNIISTTKTKPIGIGIGIGIAVEIGKPKSCDIDSDSDPDNAVRGALSDSQLMPSTLPGDTITLKGSIS